MIDRGVPDRDAAAVLRGRGLQVTAQRLAVLRAVSAHPHATAEVLIDAVRADIGAISRQGMYDVLSQLAEVGLVRRIQPMGSPARFEDRVADNHHHLVCRGCGTVVDVDCAVGSAPCLTVANDEGYVIDEAEVCYWGRCPACQSADPAVAMSTEDANTSTKPASQPAPNEN